MGGLQRRSNVASYSGHIPLSFPISTRGLEDTLRARRSSTVSPWLCPHTRSIKQRPQFTRPPCTCPTPSRLPSEITHGIPRAFGLELQSALHLTRFQTSRRIPPCWRTVLTRRR